MEKEVKKEKNKKKLCRVFIIAFGEEDLCRVSYLNTRQSLHVIDPKLLPNFSLIGSLLPNRIRPSSLSLTPSRIAQPEHLHFFSLRPPRPAASPPLVPSPSPQASLRRPSSGACPCPPLLLLEPRPPVPGSPHAAVARAEAPALPWRRYPPVADARSPPPTSRRRIRARAGLLSPDLFPSCGGPSPPSGSVAT